MKRSLLERRDRASAQHDVALTRDPTREGKQREMELRTVVDELIAVVEAADNPSSDPVEVAKTYRWLGDAYFDLGRRKDPRMLDHGAQAYQRAEELLMTANAPVEKAKLNFNYGNTLRSLSREFDVGLLEAAKIRYENAIRTFRTYHLPDLVATVEQQLRSIEPQLQHARKLAEQSKTTASDLSELQQKMAKLGEMLKRFTTKKSPVRSDEGLENEIARMLMERLQEEVASGIVSSDRAKQLSNVFGKFMETISGKDQDLDSLSMALIEMNEQIIEVMDMALDPSWSTPDPESNSRARRAVQIISPLKQYIMAEKSRRMLPSKEASMGTKLSERLIRLEARIREAGQNDETVSKIEGDLWRIATDVQEYARRYHLIIAQPDFPTARTHVRPKSVFLSGNRRLLNAAEDLAARDNLEIFDLAGRGDYARERWNQLYSSSISIFDVGVPEGAEQAQVCYELGLALALGKPSVIVSRPGQKLPFDVNLEPIEFCDDSSTDTDVLDGGIRDALSSIVWGGGEAGLGAGTRKAVEWLGRRFNKRFAEDSLRILLQLAESKTDDSVAFQGVLEQLLGMLGADAPTILVAAWPPAYPDPSEDPRCFHVMPFRPSWSKSTRNIAERVCKHNHWIYSRGDEAEAQRIVRGIWSEIGQASAVLIDITGHNPNVALELGLVHALGRPYRVVAQGSVEEHTFPSLRKVQIHTYCPGPHHVDFTETVKEFLTALGSA